LAPVFGEVFLLLSSNSRDWQASSKKLQLIDAHVVLGHWAIVHLGLSQVICSSHVLPLHDAIIQDSGSPPFLEQVVLLLHGHDVLFLV
jgi:hypothetical protein